MNVSNMSSPGLQGVDVQVWANDGTILRAGYFGRGDFASLLDSLWFLPVQNSIFGLLIFSIICIAVFVAVLVIVVWVVFKKPQDKKN